MKAFQFKDLMINVAPAGEKALCGVGATYGCGYGYSCYHFTCPALTCYFYTCYNFTCHFGPTCYVHTIPQVQAQPAACIPATVYPCGPTIALPPTQCNIPSCDNDSECGITEVKCGSVSNIPCHRGGRTDFESSTPECTEGIKNQLAAIKAQLQRELAAVEQREKAVAEALQPQTIAEVEELQGKLREALAELDKRKQELQKAEKGSKKGK